ncbi:hypothetical protein EUGRSUZ_E02559 [Eucalyptus grandis]|uniref:Uncharacterized protein n=2 Tax=Eucalyptus grandis TaxID=71139 RepID=A0ACC3KWS1_EUCGR|nr:hypothetical protein EUGRSUZ_E02559 [Eucalyptus grandis]
MCGSGTTKSVKPVKAFGWAARDSSGHLSPFKFSRRATREKDVTFKVLYYGICHSDFHNVQNERRITSYPVVPGHEIVGVITKVGTKVTKFTIGDKVGVECMVGSCCSCANCKDNLENYFPKMILSYGAKYYNGTTTYGGYSDIMVSDEHFVIKIPDNLPLDGDAPLLCAGITVYSPLEYHGLNKARMHLGIVGLGGLGHMVVKIAKVMGLKVTIISTSPNKKKEAVEHLGADGFLINANIFYKLQSAMDTVDGIIGTVFVVHALLLLIGLLKTNGKLVMVGSAIGGIKETQEKMDFAAKHNIVTDIEVIPMDYVNIAMERLLKADVKYRFVINIANSLKPI